MVHPDSRDISKLEIDCENLSIESVAQLISQQSFTVNTIFNRKLYYNLARQITFIHAAVRSKNFKLVNWLIDQKANINITFPSLGSPLHQAVKNNDLAMVYKLVSHGARLDLCEPRTGDTPLHFAVNYNNPEISKYLIENGADVNIEVAMCRMKRTETLFVKKNTECKRSPLQIYAELGNVEMTQLLLSKGGDVNHTSSDGLSPLICAILKKQLEIVKILITYGADINYIYEKNNTVLTVMHAAIDINQCKMVEFLGNLDGVDTDIKILTTKKKPSLLHYALSIPHYILGEKQMIITYLLVSGVDVNVEDDNGRLPIERYQHSYKEIISENVHKLILEHVQKLISADLPVCKRNKEFIVNSKNLDFAARCQKEVTKMKNTKIGNVHTTFYDVLRVTKYQLSVKVKGLRNDINEIKNQEKLCKKFPLYGSILVFKLAKAQRRMMRCLKVEEDLKDIFIRLGLPYDFFRELLSYLDDCDMTKMTREKLQKWQCTMSSF